MLIEAGFTRAALGEVEWTFTPSIGRIAQLGTPQEIVALYVALHGSKAGQEAAYVLACLCDQDDVTPLIGWRDDTGAWQPGAMPEGEQILIARHLMQHGIVGKAKPGKTDGPAQGGYADRFDAAEYIAAARVHLGLSSADAEALSMTEFQAMFEMKFPNAGPKKLDVPSREEYEALMRRIKERRAAQGAAR